MPRNQMRDIPVYVFGKNIKIPLFIRYVAKKPVNNTNYTDTTQAFARVPDSAPLHGIDNQHKYFPPTARILPSDSYAGYGKVRGSSDTVPLRRVRRSVDR